MRIIVLIIIGSFLFLSILGLRGLCEPDEGRYAEISREMLEGSDWLTPRLNYIKHFHKPPLVYWLVSLSFALFGMNGFTARLPVAVLGILGLVITYLLSIRMGRDKTAGFFSSLILATTLQYFSWTQVLSSDMVFSFFILLTFYGFWTRSYLFYLGIALAFLTKGPIAIIIPTLVVGVYMLITKEKIFNLLKGIILILAVVGPWFVYVCMKNPGLFRYFVFFQSLDRLLTGVHGRSGSIFYFIPVVIMGGLPWIVFLPRALRVKDRVSLFLLLWIILPIVFFSISGSKLPGYVLPIYPAIAIIVGNYLKDKRPYNLIFVICVIYLVGTVIVSKNEDRLGENLSIRKPADIIKKNSSPSDSVINFRCFLQGLPFYLKKRVILIEKEREIQFEEDINLHKDYLIPEISEFKSDGRFWAFSKLKDYPDLQKNFIVPLYEIWKGSDYILVSNHEI